MLLTFIPKDMKKYNAQHDLRALSYSSLSNHDKRRTEKDAKKVDMDLNAFHHKI